ncbi:odorant binding protein [Diachasma alloeum]|uniref:Odorant binding protein n=1 Tax=Diachasma alloeum TaxID=454923 RepID=A0A4E0RK38_9HYME|nr:odorant binding protein [Diachasma alloeum]
MWQRGRSSTITCQRV